MPMMLSVARAPSDPRPLRALCLSPGDGAQPRSDARIGAKRSRVRPRSEECFLRHVVGIGLVCHQPAEECPNRLLMSIEERVEREFRSVANRRDECDVVVAHYSRA